MAGHGGAIRASSFFPVLPCPAYEVESVDHSYNISRVKLYYSNEIIELMTIVALTPIYSSNFVEHFNNLGFGVKHSIIIYSMKN